MKAVYAPVLALQLCALGSAEGQWRRDQRWRAPDDEITQAYIPPTYWVEGATIGAAIVGTTAALAYYELGCHFSDLRSDCNAGTVITGGLVGALVGGIVGGLIGGAFEAPKPRPVQGHPGRAALIGAGAGALWSFGLFFQLCNNGCQSGEYVLGLSTTGAGALAGFLVGR